jgi:Ras-related GTP-binding protein A/B
MLIPNVKELECSLTNFADIIDADEVLLFERATFLVISHTERRPHRDPHRFEKVSNIIKQFKLSCRYLSQNDFAPIVRWFNNILNSTANWQRNSNQWKCETRTLQLSSTYLHPTLMSWSLRPTRPFVSFTFLFKSEMIYLNFSFHCVASAATLMNMKNARKHFEKLEKLSESQSSMGVRWFSIQFGR